MHTKPIVFFAILICFVFQSVFVYSQDPKTDIEQLKAKQKQLAEQIETTKKSIAEKEKQTSKVSNEIETLDKNLQVALSELENVEEQINSLEGQINITKFALEAANKKVEEQQSLLDKRVRAMYKYGFTGYFDVLLDSTSFSDFVGRADLLNKILKSDNMLLKEIKDQKETINGKRMQLEDEQKQKQDLKDTIFTKKQNVESTKQMREKMLVNLKNDLKALEDQEDKFLEQSKEITNKIVALQSANEYIGGVFGWPVPGYYKVGSGFGMRNHPILKKNKMHTGIDIGAKSGVDVIAVNSGKVIYSGYYGGYGNTIIIDHGGKVSTLYAHNSKLIANEGDTIEKGDVISKIGSTGLSTGPHLHFEVRENGSPVNPMKYLKGK